MTTFIAYHLNKGYYAFTPRGKHVETLFTGASYTVKRLRENYYYNTKTGKVSRSTKDIGESFISFDNGATFIRLPWFIPQGSEDFYLKGIAANAAKMQEAQGMEETRTRIAQATTLEVA
jgi:hypothetical protein